MTDGTAPSPIRIAWTHSAAPEEGRAEIEKRLVKILVTMNARGHPEPLGSGFLIGRAQATNQHGTKSNYSVACTAAHVLLDAERAILSRDQYAKRYANIFSDPPGTLLRKYVAANRLSMAGQLFPRHPTNAHVGTSISHLAMNAACDIAIVVAPASPETEYFRINTDPLNGSGVLIAGYSEMTAKVVSSKQNIYETTFSHRLELRAGTITEAGRSSSGDRSPLLYCTSVPVPGGVSGGPVFSLKPTAAVAGSFNVDLDVIGVLSKDLSSQNEAERSDRRIAGRSYVIPIQYLYMLSMMDADGKPAMLSSLYIQP